MTGHNHEILRSSVSDIITGVESPVTSFTAPSTAPEDDFTPFPSPVLSATSLAGLSCEPLQLMYRVRVKRLMIVCSGI